MKKIIYLIGIFVFLFSCTKEVGKKEYELIFSFSSSDTFSVNSYIFEKTKKYKNQDANNYVGKPHYGNQIYLEGRMDNGKIFPLMLFKTEAEFLAGINHVTIPLNSAIIAGNQSVEAKGVLEVYGHFEKKGRKFEVENGTFTFYWSNAPEYGEPAQELTGTWSLKRK